MKLRLPQALIAAIILAAAQTYALTVTEGTTTLTGTIVANSAYDANGISYTVNDTTKIGTITSMAPFITYTNNNSDKHILTVKFELDQAALRRDYVDGSSTATKLLVMGVGTNTSNSNITRGVDVKKANGTASIVFDWTGSVTNPTPWSSSPDYTAWYADNASDSQWHTLVLPSTSNATLTPEGGSAVTGEGLRADNSRFTSIALSSEYVKNVSYNYKARVVSNEGNTWSATYNNFREIGASTDLSAAGTWASTVEGSLVTGGRLAVSGTGVEDLGKAGEFVVGGSGQLFINTWNAGHGFTISNDIVLAASTYAGTGAGDGAASMGVLRLGTDDGDVTLGGTIKVVEDSSIHANSNDHTVNINGAVSMGTATGKTLTLLGGKYNFGSNITLGGLTLKDGVEATVGHNNLGVGTLTLESGSTLKTTVSSNVTWSMAIAGGGDGVGTIEKSGARELNINGTMAAGLNMNVKQGWVKISRGGGTHLGTLTLSGGNLTFYTDPQGDKNEIDSLVLDSNLAANSTSTLQVIAHRGRVQIDSLTLNGKTLVLDDNHSSNVMSIIDLRGASAGSGTINVQQSHSGVDRHMSVVLNGTNTLEEATLNFTMTNGSTNPGSEPIVSLAIGADEVRVGGLGSAAIVSGNNSTVKHHVNLISRAVDIDTFGNNQDVAYNTSDATARTLVITGSGATFNGIVKDNLNITMDSAATGAHQTFAGTMTDFNGVLTVRNGTLSVNGAMSADASAKLEGGTLELGTGISTVTASGGTLQATTGTTSALAIGSMTVAPKAVEEGQTAAPASVEVASAATIGTLDVTAGSRLTLTGNGDFTITDASAMAGTVVKNGTGSMTLGGSLGAGLLQMNAGSLAGTLTAGTAELHDGTTLGNFELNGGVLNIFVDEADSLKNAANIVANMAGGGALTLTSGNIGLATVVNDTPANISLLDLDVDTAYYLLGGFSANQEIAWGGTTIGTGRNAIGEDGSFYIYGETGSVARTGSLAVDDAGHLYLTMAVAHTDNLHWTGGDGVWNAAGTTVWQEGAAFDTGADTFFVNEVAPGGTAAVVTIAGGEDGLAPASVNVAGNFTFERAEGNKGLTGLGRMLVGKADGTVPTLLTLNGANEDWQGETTIRENATLYTATTNALGQGGVHVEEGGTLRLGGSVQLGNNIDGAGTIEITGSGVGITSAGAFVGTYNISDGAHLTTTADSIAAAATVDLRAAGSTLTIDGLSSSVSRNITGSGKVSILNADGGALATADTFTGTVSVENGTLGLAGNSAGAGSLVLQNGVALKLNNTETATDMTYKLVGDNHELALAAGTTATLAGTYTGIAADGTAAAATITKTGNGTLNLGNGVDVGTTLVVSGGAVNVANGDSVTLQNVTMGSGTLTFATGATVTVSGEFNTNGQNVGPVAVFSSSDADADVNASSSNIITFNAGENFVKSGTGTLAVKGTLNMTDTTVTGGTLQLITGAASLGKITLNGGDLSVAARGAGNALTISELVLINPNASDPENTTVYNANLSALVYNPSLHIQKLQLNGNTLTITDQTSANTSTYKFSGADAGTGIIDVKQSGKGGTRPVGVLLAGENTLSHATLNIAAETDAKRHIVITESNVKVGGLGSTAASTSNTTFLVSNTVVNDNSDSTTRTLTITGTGATNTFNGTVKGNLNITMGDTGEGAVATPANSVQVFSGTTSNVNGIITVNSGTLRFVNQLGAAANNPAAGAVVNGGTMDLQGASHFKTLGGTGTITNSSATERLMIVGLSGGNSSSTFSGAITGKMGLRVTNGDSTRNVLTLSGANTYTGGTTVYNNATLNVDGGSIGTAGGANGFSVYEGALLNLSNGGTIRNSAVSITNKTGEEASLSGIDITTSELTFKSSSANDTTTNATLTNTAVGIGGDYAIGRVTFKEGSSLTSTNGAVLTINDGVVFEEGVLQGTGIGYSDGQNGFRTGSFNIFTEDSSGTVNVANGAPTVKIGTATYSVAENGSINIGGDGRYYVHVNETEYSTTGNAYTATTLVVDGGSLSMAASLAETATGGIELIQSGTVTLGRNATLAASSVHWGADTTLTLAGTGTYQAGNVPVSGVALDEENWRGTVEVSGLTSGNDINFAPISVTGSTVEVTSQIQGTLASNADALGKGNLKLDANLIVSTNTNDTNYVIAGDLSGTGNISRGGGGAANFNLELHGDADNWSGTLVNTGNNAVNFKVNGDGEQTVGGNFLNSGSGQMNIAFTSGGDKTVTGDFSCTGTHANTVMTISAEGSTNATLTGGLSQTGGALNIAMNSSGKMLFQPTGVGSHTVNGVTVNQMTVSNGTLEFDGCTDVTVTNLVMGNTGFTEGRTLSLVDGSSLGITMANGSGLAIRSGASITVDDTSSFKMSDFAVSGRASGVVAEITSTATSGTWLQGSNTGILTIDKALVTYTGSGATLASKLTDSSVTHTGTGKLTLSGTGSTLDILTIHDNEVELTQSITRVIPQASLRAVPLLGFF